jgi:hypothetical protein
MDEKGNGKAAIAISPECLWALGFGAATMGGMFGEFQKLMAIFAEKVGPRPAAQG